jgi:hypothetical protein
LDADVPLKEQSWMKLIRFTMEHMNKGLIVYVKLDRVTHASYDGSRAEMALTYLDHNNRTEIAYLKGDDAINVQKALDRAVSLSSSAE